MKKTDNFSLNKPDTTDFFNVEHWNQNAEIIDEELKKLSVAAENTQDAIDELKNRECASTATGANPTIQDSTNAPLIYGKFKGYTSQDGEPTPDNPVEINGLAKDGAIEVRTTGILGEETTANIPTDAPLYDGDYLEVYADGSGKLVRTMAEVVLDGSDDENLTAYTTGSKGNFIQLLLNDIKQGANLISSQLQVTNPYNNAGSCIYALTTNNGIWFRISDDITSVADTRAWLRSKPMTVVYELATPTETPLTAEQVAQFKQLYTFEPVTNVLCDGEVEMRYYKANVNGETVGIVHKKVEASEKTIEQLPNTFAKKSIYDNNAISYGRKVDSTVGEGSIAFGLEVEAPINYGVAVGAKTRAGDCAFACGHTNSANGLCSSASGFNTTVDGEYSHVEGAYTKASSNCQHVQGKYNVEDTEHKYAHIIGGGNSETDRKNIHTIDWNGNADFAGEVKCSNVLKTLAECEASTKDTDIASAMALGELKESFKSIILNSAYPIGTVYMSTQNTSPATFLGGAWSAVSADKYFKTITSGTGGSTGGSSTSGSTTLTVNQIPSHKHDDLVYSDGGGKIGLQYSGASGSNQYSLAVGSGTSIATQTAGGGQGHTHTINPPYYTVYAWVRTA